MKRYTILMLVLAMLISALPTGSFSISVSTDNVWDGSVADGFAGGSGTKDDPYVIMTAEQLAYFAHSVNSGVNYNDKYVRLGSNIRLNDEEFSFDTDTAMVRVTDGDNEGYLGTGIKGTYNNYLFDTTASQKGIWYADNAVEEKGKYSGKLNYWTPIGAEGDPFKGHFDGNGYTISGVFINSPYADDQGLFGYSMGYIDNVGLTDSLVMARNHVGGISGYNELGEISGCYFAGIVGSSVDIGGIAGVNTGRIKACRSSGSVMGSRIGGITGSNTGGLVSGCCNTGTALGDLTSGGIVGLNSLSGTVELCCSSGTVIGGTYQGGIVGRNEENAVVQKCYNIGYLQGLLYSGGIIGYNSESLIKDCFNAGMIYSCMIWSYSGGIVGLNYHYAEIRNVYNIGRLGGNEGLGGIVGGNDSTKVYGAYYLKGCATDMHGKDLGGGGANIRDNVVGEWHGYDAKTMKNATAYRNFDFENVWEIDPGVNDGYPILKDIPVQVNSVELKNDIPEGAWYEGAVGYVVSRELMNGVAANLFAPDGTTTRAMVVTVLHRMEETPTAETVPPFTDVKDAWYMGAVAWAYENKIIDGMSHTVFAPDAEITREQLATILYRYAAFKGVCDGGADGLDTYPDAEKVSSWAEDAVKWANTENIIRGTNVNGEVLLDPQGRATRAQVATILMRFCENITNKKAV